MDNIPITQRAERDDWRNITTGSVIPSEEGYCDQPYVVKTDDGAWLCVLTTGKQKEGSFGQHVVATRSTDQGKTWSALVDIEPPGPPESSWVMPLKTPNGRVYAFYVYNRANLREVKADVGVNYDYCRHRVDTLGDFVFRYSDDHGKTWSKQRYVVPIREMEVDRENPYGGKIRFFWGVGNPITANGKVYIGLSKVGRFGFGFMTVTEGIFLCSDNILTESDPAKIRWETLPDGDVGLRSPAGPIGEEHNLVALRDGSLYCTYRTIDGHPCHAYSRDRGHTWTAPEHMTYTPNGRRVKNPRAANFVWRCSNGNFLYWFHNHGGKWYEDRNPAWLCGGVERDGFIYWSQPEIVLYDEDPVRRMSYPNLIEENGRHYITETQKTIARVHELDPALVTGLWNQAQNTAVCKSGLVLELTDSQCAADSPTQMPHLPDLRNRGGFSFDFWVRFENLRYGQVVLDARDAHGHGILIASTHDERVAVVLSDGETTAAWECDPQLLRTGEDHHIAAIIDGGPKIIMFVVDGVLCDGWRHRQYGWGRFNPHLGDVNGLSQARVGENLHGVLHTLRVYNRALRISEVIGNFRAGFGACQTKQPTKQERMQVHV